jgi:hypothetical protein
MERSAVDRKTWRMGTPTSDRLPGKITLIRGLRRLIDMLATQSVLSRYASQHQGLPPNITAFLQGWTPPN